MANQLKRLKRAANDMNSVLGLNPEIDPKGDEGDIAAEILENAGSIKDSEMEAEEIENDDKTNLTEETWEVIKELQKEAAADDDDDEDEDEKPSKKSKSKKSKKDDDDDEDEEEEDKPMKKDKKDKKDKKASGGKAVRKGGLSAYVYSLLKDPATKKLSDEKLGRMVTKKFPDHKVNDERAVKHYRHEMGK